VRAGVFFVLWAHPLVSLALVDWACGAEGVTGWWGTVALWGYSDPDTAAIAAGLADGDDGKGGEGTSGRSVGPGPALFRVIEAIALWLENQGRNARVTLTRPAVASAAVPKRGGKGGADHKASSAVAVASASPGPLLVTTGTAAPPPPPPLPLRGAGGGPAPPPARPVPLRVAVAGIAALYLLGVYARPAVLQGLSLGVRPRMWPVRTAAFLRDHADKIQPNLYHTNTFGNWLTWQLPEYRVWADTRETIFAPLESWYRHAFDKPPALRMLIKNFDVGSIVTKISGTAFEPAGPGLGGVLGGSFRDVHAEFTSPADWGLAAWDDVSTVWLERARPGHAEVLADHEFMLLRPSLPHNHYGAFLRRTREWDAIWAEDLARCERWQPGDEFCAAANAAWRRRTGPPGWNAADELAALARVGPYATEQWPAGAIPGDNRARAMGGPWGVLGRFFAGASQVPPSAGPMPPLFAPHHLVASSVGARGGYAQPQDRVRADPVVLAPLPREETHTTPAPHAGVPLVGPPIWPSARDAPPDLLDVFGLREPGPFLTGPRTRGLSDEWGRHRAILVEARILERCVEMGHVHQCTIDETDPALAAWVVECYTGQRWPGFSSDSADMPGSGRGGGGGGGYGFRSG